MTTAQMVSRLNSALDQEASATTFWTLTHYYEALAAGQQEVINHLQKRFLEKQVESPFLSILLKDLLVTTFYIALPKELDKIKVARYAYDGVNYKLATIIDYEDLLAKIENPFLIPSKNTPKFYIKGTTLGTRTVYFYPENASAKATISYWINPPAIGSAQEPTLASDTHEAIIRFALHILRKREQGGEEKSAIALKEYGALVNEIK